ncbi:hypothetical protein FSP39_010500 [Pinctada imbricata]|uniref:DMA domain-containing protein n=1 Tax=Pinctada imbricata TaxID=66713 RepID=A0AA89BTD3_PINIB|nr:hypothetical protein FSP39_010500 [Pinctada imbricata]
MAAQVALKRQQAAEDAIALGLRCASEGNIPIMTQGPLWGPGTVSPPEKTQDEQTDVDIDVDSSDDQDNISEGGKPLKEDTRSETPSPEPVEPSPLQTLEKQTLKQPSLYARAQALIPQSAFLPGRLSNLEILERIFPFQRKSVLELVLQGCNGDLVKAIEQFLSSQESILGQHGTDEDGTIDRIRTSEIFHTVPP